MKRAYICSLVFALLLTACAKIDESTPDESMSSDTLGLQWYAEKDTVKQEMQAYTLKNESEETSPAGQVQTLLEYSGVTLYEQPCDVILCFTSQGLIGINYHDEAGQYAQWVERVTAAYGEPTETSDFGMTIWENDPIGAGTTIYVFDMEDDVQISFFTDDSGSEQRLSNPRQIQDCLL